jgi:TPR repeat protein
MEIKIANDDDSTGQLHVGALDPFRKAAEQGDATGQWRLGQMYSLALGLNRTKTKRSVGIARQLNKETRIPKTLSEICMPTTGAVTMASAGVLRMRSSGIAEPPSRGIGLRKKALAGIYVEGKGVPKNEIEAYKWMILAAVEDADARDRLSSLEQSLSPSQRERGQELASEF